jgi:hypothetical protein
MRMRHGVFLVLAGVTASAFAWGWHADQALEREPEAQTGSRVAGSPVSTVSTASERPQTFSAKHPLLAEAHVAGPDPIASAVAPDGRWAPSRVHNSSPISQKRATGPAPDRKLTSL